MRHKWNEVATLLNIAALLFLASLVAGCAVAEPTTPSSRDQLIENLGPIVAIEQRAKSLTNSVQKLAFLGGITEEDGKTLKEHYDIYYVYHEAAAVYLAQGDLVTYKSHVDLAGKELDLLESKLRSLTSSRFRPEEKKQGSANWLLSF